VSVEMPGGRAAVEILTSAERTAGARNKKSIVHFMWIYFTI
jgi:hypothetical protein